MPWCVIFNFLYIFNLVVSWEDTSVGDISGAFLLNNVILKGHFVVLGANI